MAERGNGTEGLGKKEAREFGGRPAVFWHVGDEGTEEGASLHQQGIRIAASYFRYREAGILSLGDGSKDTPDICCTLDGETILADMVSVAYIEEQMSIPELTVTSDDFWRCRRKALLWLADHRVPSVRYDLMTLGIFAPKHARIRHLAGVYFWSDEPDQLAFYCSDEDEGSLR